MCFEQRTRAPEGKIKLVNDGKRVGVLTKCAVYIAFAQPVVSNVNKPALDGRAGTVGAHLGKLAQVWVLRLEVSAGRTGAAGLGGVRLAMH